MRLNRTSEWKFMSIWISLEQPLFNNQCLDILCTWTTNLSEKLWPFTFLASFRCSISSVSIYYAPELDIRVKSYDHFNFSRASVVQYRASQYIMRLNRTYEWKVMTIWISRDLPWFNFGRLHMWCASIGPSCEKLWPLEFLERFRCLISSVSIYYEPESDIRVKIYDHFNFTRTSVVQFRVSLYVMRLN